jgi:hypothetical protein
VDRDWLERRDREIKDYSSQGCYVMCAGHSQATARGTQREKRRQARGGQEESKRRGARLGAQQLRDYCAWPTIWTKETRRYEITLPVLR